MPQLASPEKAREVPLFIDCGLAAVVWLDTLRQTWCGLVTLQSYFPFLQYEASDTHKGQASFRKVRSLQERPIRLEQHHP